MSRIGKKPIALPTTVKYTVDGNTVLVEGPKGKVTALIPKGITLVKKDDGELLVERENDKQAGFHGLARALVYQRSHRRHHRLDKGTSTSSASATAPN